VLQELPLVSSIDYNVDDDQHSFIRLFDTQLNLEKATYLLNTTDPYLVEMLSRTLSQIDTSKM
jgi:hypothetical protein